MFAPGPPPPPPLNGQDNGNVPTGSRTADANRPPTPSQPNESSDPPTFTQKAIMFLSLGVATLHPEGRLRTEMNSTGNAEPSEDESRRQATQHSRRPSWVKDYVIRVRAGDWLDE
ncbi:hypothetical protein EDD16DRAFT_1542611 [Pisolithus croceorrhizus]|nr:hypothetical protein EDD16DRAFT_1542611 [Pisolithus croceorrhizus]